MMNSENAHMVKQVVDNLRALANTLEENPEYLMDFDVNNEFQDLSIDGMRRESILRSTTFSIKYRPTAKKTEADMKALFARYPDL